MLRISPSNPNILFWKKGKKVPFRKKLAQMMNIDASVLVSKIKQKGKNEYVQSDFLEGYIVGNNDDDRVTDMFALVVYGTLVFPQSPRYVDAVVVDLIEQISSQTNPDSAIIAKTIRSLNFCKRKGKKDFIGCAQLLYIWI